MARMTEAQANKLRRQVGKITASHTDECLALCEVLYETYYAEVAVPPGDFVPACTLWGYEDWNMFVEHEVGMHWTTAIAYRKVHELLYVDFEGLWVKEELPTSITKLQLLTRAPITKRNISGWLKKARELSCCQLELMVRGEEAEDVCNVCFPMTTSMAEEVRGILDKYKDTFGVPSRGDALLKIVRVFHRAQRKKSKVKKAS